ncbi:uncharacterized protein TRIADDRAFT_51595 [Trichoplax adhaerens]|uniref:Uncharacterized protein n=1 Tax=Trichoplax adhaerens TaxID=10228 RepID=B3RK21_TRIAD|nr:predicted protein [Trichoplax adhaerens]EDV29360.1 predicted protein [Trichoplax adhaerens]|eukprot:XP_002108562.1 predicted protein [Trichoplax adhaerens]
MIDHFFDESNHFKTADKVTCGNYQPAIPSKSSETDSPTADGILDEMTAFLADQAKNNVAIEHLKGTVDSIPAKESEKASNRVVRFETFINRDPKLKQMIEIMSAELKKPVNIYYNQHHTDDVELEEKIVSTSQLQEEYAIAFTSDIFQFIQSHNDGLLLLKYILRQELYKLICPIDNDGIDDYGIFYAKKLSHNVYAHLFALNNISNQNLKALKYVYCDFVISEFVSEERRKANHKYYQMLLAIAITYDVDQSSLKIPCTNLTKTKCSLSLDNFTSVDPSFQHIFQILELTQLVNYIDQCIDGSDEEKLLKCKWIKVVSAARSQNQLTHSDSLTPSELKDRIKRTCVIAYAIKITKWIDIVDYLNDLLEIMDYNKFYPTSLIDFILSLFKERWKSYIPESYSLRCIGWLVKILNGNDANLSCFSLQILVDIISREKQPEVCSKMMDIALTSFRRLGCYQRLWNQLEMPYQRLMLSCMDKFRHRLDGSFLSQDDITHLAWKLKMQWCINIFDPTEWAICSKAKAFITVFQLFGNRWSEEFYNHIQKCNHELFNDLLRELSEAVRDQAASIISDYMQLLQNLAKHLSYNNGMLLVIIRNLAFLCRNSNKFKVIDFIGSFLDHDWKTKAMTCQVFAYWVYATIYVSYEVKNKILPCIFKTIDRMKNEEMKSAAILIAYYIALKRADEVAVQAINQKYGNSTRRNLFRRENLYNKVKQWLKCKTKANADEFNTANAHENILFQEYAAFDRHINQFYETAHLNGLHNACKNLIINT